MDLRTGETVWIAKNGPPAVYPPLEQNLECDVVIIGGGITGALIARELGREGLQCVLIDKREPGGGSTSASTALLLYELDTPLWELAGEIGEEDAAASYQACVGAVGKLAQLAEELGVPCDFITRKSYYFAETPADVPALKLECNLRAKHGIPVEFLHQAEIEKLFSFSRPAALLSRGAGEVDVVQFVSALHKASMERGLRIYGHTAMSRFDVEPGKVIVHTDTGCKITARQIVFATGYESEKYLGYKIGELKSSFAIATHPVAAFPGWHDQSLLWTTGDPYLYLRTTADRRVVIGGEDIDFQDDRIRDALIPEKAAILEKKLRALFPGLEFKLACAWAGTFGETENSLARIGSPHDRPNVHFALGYGGNGTTYSMLAAEIIRDACLGRHNPTARLFRLER